MPSVRHESAARPVSPPTPSSTQKKGSTIARRSRAWTGTPNGSKRSSVPAPNGTHGKRRAFSRLTLHLVLQGVRAQLSLAVALPTKRGSRTPPTGGFGDVG